MTKSVVVTRWACICVHLSVGSVREGLKTKEILYGEDVKVSHAKYGIVEGA